MKSTVVTVVVLFVGLLPTVPALADDPDLWDPSLDYTYIIVAADSLCSAVQPLKEHRENDFCGNFSNTHKVILVSTSQVASQFGESHTGIKDFLRYAYHNWAATPEYVLLVGYGCYYDLSGDRVCLIPSVGCSTFTAGQPVTSDDWYVCVDGPGDFKPDMAIGRLPAKRPQDVEAYVNKVLAYDLGGISRAANDNFLFLCHDVMVPNPPASYPVAAAGVLGDSLVMGLQGQWNVTTLTASSLCDGSPEQCYDIWENAAINVLNEAPSGNAPLVVGGLASYSTWANFMYFFSLEMGFSMSSLNTTSVYPFFVGACCGLGRFFWSSEPPVSPMTSEVFLFEPGKGAIGWIGPSEYGAMLHTNYWFSREFYAKLREPDKTIGSAFLEAKLQCLQTNTIDLDAVRNYSFLGDPALVLARNYVPQISAVSAPNAVDPGEVAPLEVFYNDRNKTCCIGDCYDEIWSINWEAELGTVIEDEGWPVVPPTATYYAPEDAAGVYDHVTVTVTDKMGLSDVWVEDIYIRHSKPGCPYLFVFDGESFRRDNNISNWAYSDDLNRQSSADYYKLRIRPAGEEYVMEIRGLEREISFFDRISLLAVDHGDSTTIGVTADGSLFPYTTLRPPLAAVDQDGRDRLAAVSSRDSLSFKGRSGDYIVLTFEATEQGSGLMSAALDGDGGGVVMGGDGKVDPCEDGGCNGGDELAGETSSQGVQPRTIPKGIVVEAEDSDGRWIEVGYMRPREHLSEMVVPSTTSVSGEGLTGRVRLLWTGEHSLNYVGLVTRATEALGIRSLEPSVAVHSVEGSVLADVTRRDDNRACIAPGEKVSITFAAQPPEDGVKRDLVLVTDGYFTRETDPALSMQMTLPTRDLLELATPNPFRSEIAIHYAVAAPGHRVDIALFDAEGRLVKTLSSDIKPPGMHVVIWDGRTEKGRPAPAGVYFCRMSTKQRTTSTKIVRMK